MSYLSVSADSKTRKGEAMGYLTGILYLAPHRLAGTTNVCPHASPACQAACLYSAGRGAFSNVQQARIAKTRALFADPGAFVHLLGAEIESLVAKAKRLGMRPCVRLNGTSDIAWERMGVPDRFPKVPFYDYTKNPDRFRRSITEHWPANYRLTFSRSETNEGQCISFLTQGGNVSVVFRKELPKAWNGFRVVDGDLSDLRFLDPRGVVVGLRAKGKARQDRSGFVVD